MQVICGAMALAGFRLERSRRELAQVRPELQLEGAHFVYLFEDRMPTEPEARRRLAALFDEGHESPSDQLHPTLYVLPRFGTISPWSSKATDILGHCGFTTTGRVERGIAYAVSGPALAPATALWRRVEEVLADRMTQVMIGSLESAEQLFVHPPPAPEAAIPIAMHGREALVAADRRLGLALGGDETDYLLEAYRRLGRDPTETELMMFAQVNSEHCRHRIFRGRWTLDGELLERSPFDCIRASYQANPGGILSAYKDNAAVFSGPMAQAYYRDPASRCYAPGAERLDIAIKVETHNHPTGVAPFPGAATGSGGEMRDEAAVGRGAVPKAGFTGFAVSDLRLPGAVRPWERGAPPAPALASALRIMLDGPIGAASFNNEFGRPAIAGFFRSFCVPDPAGPAGRFRGYHKPVMLAGGVGTVRRALVEKLPFGAGTAIVVLGGPAMEIGLGGGAASSRSAGEDTALDFASVQRGNPEMQRRAQEVIEAAVALGERNPILAIHDVGAGGLSNAVPEILEGAGVGGAIDLARIPSAEPGMSPMALWCNEAQERYVLALAPGAVEGFERICARERCPCALIGEATAERRLRVSDGRTGATVVDLPMRMLFGDLALREISGASRSARRQASPMSSVTVPEALERVLTHPGVGDKSFLITIGDRTVGGLVARDPLVGPWQVAVADVAVTAADYTGVRGEALALGERMPVAVADAVASARLAVGEALTNIAAADVSELAGVRLSANWMAAVGEAPDNAALYRAVRAVGAELCPALGVAIPVGKDSLAMRVAWPEGGKLIEVRAPVTLVASAFAPVADVGATLSPVLVPEPDTELWLLDLGGGRNRLGGSILAQVLDRSGDPVPDLDDPPAFKRFFAAVRQLAAERLLLSYHDRSDGGLAVALVEMALAGHSGIEIDVARLGADPVAALFAEELGAVVQIRSRERDRVRRLCDELELGTTVVSLGSLRDDGRVVIANGSEILLDAAWPELMRTWAEVSYRMRALRDEPGCARDEYETQCDAAAPGLATARLAFDPAARPAISTHRPRVAIVREQGVNGHRELAAAFARAGFDAVDVHMSDLAEGRATLEDFSGMAAPGGFSYGDVLGAGQGWAKSILYHSRLRDLFANFLWREDRFALGVCNGCQMLAGLAELIPGAERWPRFRRNRSEQFEARLCLVEILDSVSPFFAGMAGSLIPIAVAHGEGRAEFTHEDDLAVLHASGRVPLRFATAVGSAAERYPANPNGSPGGATAFVNSDGRVLILMPHPERVFRTLQMSWHPPEWPVESPWLRLFENIRTWAG